MEESWAFFLVSRAVTAVMWSERIYKRKPPASAGGFIVCDAISVDVTANSQPSFARPGRAKAPVPNINTAHTNLLGFRARDPTRTWNFTMTLVIVEKFHLVIGLCARHGMVVDGTESWSIVEKWQRRLGGEHGFVEGGANRSLCNRKNSKRTPVHVRDANVVSDHRTVVGVREPAHLHRTGDFYSGGPGCAAIQRGGEAHVQLAGAGGATLVGIVVVNDRD